MKIPLKVNNKYLISENGDIYSLYRGKYLSYSPDNTGYNRVNLYCGGKQKKFLVHRLLAETFIPNPNNYEYINHINGDKLDNILSNLEWCTSSYNQIHAYNNSLKKLPKGTLNGRDVLTEYEVLEIYDRLLSGESCISVSNDYSVAPETIADIKSKRRWSHLIADLQDIEITKRSKVLSDDSVIEICKMLSEGQPIKEISIMTGVSKYIVYDIKRRKSFRRISYNYKWQ